MRIQNLRAMTYLYSSTRTSFDSISESGTARTVSTLQQFMTAAGVRPTGPMLLICHDPTEDPAALFDLEIGFPVSEQTPAPGDFKIRTLVPFRCATMVYRGPLKHLRRAYDKLIPEMIAAGYVPSEQSRENFLVWEGAESSNNVVEIEVGIR